MSIHDFIINITFGIFQTSIQSRKNDKELKNLSHLKRFDLNINLHFFFFNLKSKMFPFVSRTKIINYSSEMQV